MTTRKRRYFWKDTIMSEELRRYEGGYGAGRVNRVDRGPKRPLFRSQRRLDDRFLDGEPILTRKKHWRNAWNAT